MSQVNQDEPQETAVELMQELSAEREARGIVYNFLSSLFAKEVTQELVAQLVSAQGQSFLHSLALEPSLSASVNEINANLGKLNCEASLLDLAADFCGLFLVDGRTCASPYAGQYLGAEQSDERNNEANNARSNEPGGKRKTEKTQLFGELHQQMTEFLTNSKLQIHSDFPEPSDHIAVMLAYIAHLCVTVESEQQLNFINRYLLTWVDDFTQQINKHDHGLFYRAVAGLTVEWLKIDIEYLVNSEQIGGN